MSNSQLISIVIPVLNEEGNISAVYNAVKQGTEDLLFDFEIIFVDDGSTDRTADLIMQLHDDDPAVKLIRFARNFGGPAAITAGMQYASGVAVVSMDADLQHPPSLLPKMIAKWQSGYDVVLTQRDYGNSVGIFNRLTSALYCRVINSLTDRPLIPGATDFRLLGRNVVDEMNQLPERHRFMRGLVSWVGFRQVAVPYTAGSRHSGTTKYSFRKLLRTAADGITSFSTVPLRIATYLGLFAALAGVPYAVWAVWVGFLRPDIAVPGWASLIVAILFLGGVQLVCLGILGEYVGRIYDEVKCRPLYIARETLGIRPTQTANHRHCRSPAEPTLPGSSDVAEFSTVRADGCGASRFVD